MDIQLVNCGIVKSASLSFSSGLNLILGPSSSGKSTLFRSIRSFISNSFTDSSITYSKSTLGVKITYDNHTYQYVRSPSSSVKAQYVIDQVSYSKLGRVPLPQVSQLGLSPIQMGSSLISFNFNSQFSGPFLLLSSPSVLYDVVSHNSTIDYQKLNDCYKRDLRDINHSIELKTSLLDQYKLDLSRVSQDFSYFVSLYEKSQSLVKTANDFKEFKSLLLSRCPDLTLSPLNTDYWSLYFLIKSLPQIPKLPNLDFSYIENLFTLRSSAKELVSLAAELASLSKEISREQGNISELEKELESIPYCPLCNQEIHHDHT